MNLSEKTAYLQKLLNNENPTLSRVTYRQQYHKLCLSRRTSEFVFVLILQVINAKLDTLGETAHLLSFSAAVNLILIFWRGFHLAPALLLSNLLVCLIPSTHTSVIGALTNTLEPCLIIYFSRRICGPVIPFAHLKDWYGYLMVCSVVTLSVSTFRTGIMLDTLLPRLNAYTLIVPSNLIYASYPFLKHLISKRQKHQLFLAITVIVTGALLTQTLATSALFYLFIAESAVLLLALQMQLYGLAFGNLAIALGLMTTTWPMQQPLLISTVLIISCCCGFQIAVPYARRKSFNI